MQGRDESNILKVVALCEAIAGGVIFYAAEAHSVQLEAIILWGLAAYSLYRAYALIR